jgi:hypothetical protein
MFKRPGKQGLFVIRREALASLRSGVRMGSDVQSLFNHQRAGGDHRIHPRDARSDRQLATDARRLSRLCSADRPQRAGRREGTHAGALGHAGAAAVRRRADHEHSQHWRAWLKTEHRCVVPFTSFCEYADTKPRKTPTWFALDGERPLAFFRSGQVVRLRWSALHPRGLHRLPRAAARSPAACLPLRVETVGMHNPVSTGKPFGPDGQPRCRLQYQCLIASRQGRGCAFLLSQPATVSRVMPMEVYPKRLSAAQHVA